MTEKIDRAKVLRFFTWTSRELGFLIIAIGCMIVATWVMYLGVAVALKDAEKTWISSIYLHGLRSIFGN